MPDKNERLMGNEEVKGFFPDNLAQLLGFPEEEILYIGIDTETPREFEGMQLISKELYLVPALRDTYLWKNRIDLDMRASKNRWINEEGWIYEGMRTGKYRYPFFGYDPLLVLRIQNWTQPIETPFRFAEMLRYADHQCLRKKGVAAAVLDSVCNGMAASYQTQYLYVNYSWPNWPKKSEVIPVGFSAHLISDIMSCFAPGYHRTDDFDRMGFFRLTDPIANSGLHRSAMKRYEEMCRGH